MHDRIVIFSSLTEYWTDFGHPVKNPTDAATHRLSVNICSLVRGEKQRETSSIDRSRLRGRRGRNDGTVGGSWKDEEQESRSWQTHGGWRNVDECVAQCNPSPSRTAKATKKHVSVAENMRRVVFVNHLSLREFARHRVYGSRCQNTWPPSGSHDCEVEGKEMCVSREGWTGENLFRNRLPKLCRFLSICRYHSEIPNPCKPLTAGSEWTNFPGIATYSTSTDACDMNISTTFLTLVPLMRCVNM